MKYTVEEEDIDLFDDTSWKLAVIIDSCRYDIFKEEYEKILGVNGVTKAFSHCNCTRDWMEQHLDRDFIDIVYVNHTVSLGLWLPNTKFFKVEDVWKTHWDYEEWGGVMPWSVTNVALETMKRYPKKRILVHYSQPHPPYLLPEYKKFNNKLLYTPEACLAQKSTKTQKHSSHTWKTFYQGGLRDRIGYERTWKLLIRLGIQPVDYYGKIYKEFGMMGLAHGYRENLKTVLKETKRLLEASKGEVLITSDHSQSFIGDKKNLLNEPVPWLVIK